MPRGDYQSEFTCTVLVDWAGERVGLFLIHTASCDASVPPDRSMAPCEHYLNPNILLRVARARFRPSATGATLLQPSQGPSAPSYQAPRVYAILHPRINISRTVAQF